MQAIGQNTSASGIVQVMVAASLWATVGVASKLVPAGESLSDAARGVARLAVGGPVILAFVLLTRRVSLRAFRALDLRQLLFFALGCAVFQVCLFRAFTLLGVTATVFLTVCLPPVMSCAWAMLRGRAAVSPTAAAALALATAGIFLFAAGHGTTADPGSLGPGLVLAVIASIAFVAMTESARQMTRDAGPLVVAGAGLTLAGLLMLAAVLLTDPGAVEVPQHHGWTMLALTLYLGIGPTALAYVVYCSGMARCRSASIGLIASMVEPGLAALLAWMVLAERLGPFEALGCAMVTGAMALLWWSERRG